MERRSFDRIYRIEKKEEKMKKGKFGAVMLMVLVSVLAMAVMMVSIGSAEGATITVKAGTGGRVSPSGTITIKDGTTQQFGLVTSSGFTILSVTGCNGTLSKTSSGSIYTTGRVTGSCTVTASFKLLAPKISSFKINNDAVETAIQSVSLNFSMATGSTPTGYRASERSDFVNSSWKAFVAVPTFELSPGAGSKTVYLQLSDSSTGSVSNVMSDSINMMARQLYYIPGRDFYVASKTSGFNSRVDELDATSVCSIEEGPADNLQANQVAARILGQQSNDLPLGCDFTFFDAKTLQNGFVFKTIEGYKYPIVEGCDIRERSRPAAGSTSVKITLHGEASANRECQYIINQMILEGPANTDWHTALGLKP